MNDDSLAWNGVVKLGGGAQTLHSGLDREIMCGQACTGNRRQADLNLLDRGRKWKRTSLERHGCAW